MRFPTFPTIVRNFNFYIFSNFRTSRIPYYKALSPPTRATIKSMPTIPFLSSLFSTSSSKPKMSYPVQKSDDEWQAVLSKGSPPSLLFTSTFTDSYRTIPRAPSTRYRSSRLRGVRQTHALHRSLHLRRLRCSPLHRESEVQVWLRVARVLR